MKNAIIMTSIYFIGLFIFLFMGICDLSILFYIALAIGLIGSITMMLKSKNKKNRV